MRSTALVVFGLISSLACSSPQSSEDEVGNDSVTVDSAGTESTDSETGDPACDPATNDPMTDAAMTFRLTNLGATAIFVAATDDCVSNDFRLRSEGVDALWSSTIPAQGNRCDDMPPCGFGCTNDDPEQYLRIEAGASVDIVWDGYWWETVTLAGSCFIPECEGDVICNAGRQADVGEMFELEALAFTECTPSDFECDCAPGEMSCLVYTYGGVTGASETSMQAFAFEPDGLLELVFGA